MNAKFRPARMAQRLGRCLNEGSGEIVVSVKMPSTRGWTERPRAPLLQLDVGVWDSLSRIGGWLDWGGRLLNCNGGAQRFPQHGWKSCVERNGIRELDCETDKSSRCESRP